MLEYSVFSILAATVLGFIAGINLTWTSPEISNLNSTDTGPFNGKLTTDEAAWISGLMSLGAAFGPFIFGYFADKIGRKFSILLSSLPYIISSILCAFANTVAEFYLARFLTGISIGGTFTLLPMYIGEMSLDEHRGILGSAMNVFICLGIFYTYVIGTFITNVMYFNIMMACLAGGALIIFGLVGVETPHYLIMKNKHDTAKEALLKIRKQSDSETEKELDHIKNIIEGEEQASIIDIFRSKPLTKAFIIGAGLVFFQQASGINAILFFAQQIFKDAGTTLKPEYCSMIIGSVQFSTSFITPTISNRFGRKILLIFSGIGMFLSESLLGAFSCFQEHDKSAVSDSLNFLPILSLVCYIFTYNVGFGPLPWVVVGEIFPSSVKSSAGALVTFTCWITSFFITRWFQQISDLVGRGECFLGFAVASLIATIFVQFFVIETKGKSLKQIQEDLNN